MRTTVTLDDDVAAAVRQLRRDESVGVSEALNRLARRGMGVKRQARPFRQKTYRMKELLDITNVEEALDIAEGPFRR